MASFVSTFTDVGLVNTATNAGTITLPPTTQIPFRQLIFKDSYGNTSNRPLRLSTQLGDTFEDGTTVRVLKDSFGFQTLYAYNNVWYFLGGTNQNAVTFSTLTVSSINSATPGSLNAIPPFLSTFTVSTGSLNVSSITALTLNVSTTGTISSLIVNSLQFGDGNGWVNIGPLQTVAVSSIQANTNSLYANNTYLGIQSSITAVQFFGLQGNFNNTVIAEVSTGAGVEELLLFKGSSTSDRVRVQTTGTFVVETGVSSRLWDSNGIATQSNVTPAFIVNTSSNVGIQTATPATTLDVNGTTRTITLSTQQILTSSINGSAVLLTPQLFSTVAGLGTAGYISSQQLFSTVTGLGTTGYISSQQLLSTTRGLETYISSFIDPTELASSITSTVIGIGLAPNLTSTTIGLGTIGYISSQQLLSTAAGLIDVPELLSSLTGLGSLGYISSQQLLSTAAGLIDVPELLSSLTGLGSLGYISSQQLISTTRGLETYISSFIDPTELTSSITSTVIGIGLAPNLTSTTIGLGTLGYISSQQLLSTTRGLETYISSFIDPTELTSSITSTVIGIGLAPNLTSTTIGLGTIGYISSQQLLSTAAGLIDVPELLSSLTGLGSLGYVSTLSLVSTTTGISRSGFISSPNLLGLVSTTFLDTSLQSTTTGISRSGFISTPNLLNLVSTQNLLGLVSTPFVDTALQSTVRGLATSGYISTSQLTSTVAGLGATLATPPFLSSFTVSTGALNASSILGITANISSTATISSLIVNSLQFGDGTGWVNIGPIEAVAVSTAQLNTNTLYTNNSLFGTASTVTALQFYGLQGNYNNTVLAEVSTGSGTQEFLVFKGSSASDRIRMQTTGSIVFEPGVSSRLWNSNTTATLSNATPAMIINSSSNVGIQTLNPGATLDVNGSIRGVSVSSQQLFVSSVNGSIPIVLPNLTSTVAGLASGGAGFPSSISTIYGSTFTTLNLTASTISFVNISTQGSTIFVAVGQDANSNATIKYSYNGSNWSNTTGTGFAWNGTNFGTGFGVAWNGSYWIAVGSSFVGGPTSYIKRSADGINWSDVGNGTIYEQSGRCIAWNGSYWLSGGDANSRNRSLIRSTDGINWTPISLSAFYTVNGVAWNGTFWVALGYDFLLTSSPILYSANGINWTAANSTGFQSANGGRSAVWNGRMWVACGGDNISSNRTIKYSFDTSNWFDSVRGGFDSAVQTGFGVAWNGFMWVCTGNTNIKYSFDGSNWSNSASGVGNSLLGYGGGVTWNGTRWIVATSTSDSASTILTSVDGSNWIGSISGFSGSFTNNSPGGYGVAIQSNLIPSYRQNFLTIDATNVPFAVGPATNEISLTTSSMTLNGTLTVSWASTFVGIQTYTPQAPLDVAGLGRFQNLSTQNIQVSSINGGQLLAFTSLQSTVTGLGSAGYISSQQLISTTRGLETYISTFIDPTELASSITSTVFGLGLDSRFASTVTGLGSSGYVSTLSLISTTAGLVDVPELQSSLIGLGSLGFLSTSQLTSTVQGLGSASYISSLQLISTTFGLTSNISTTFSTLASGIPGAYGATLLYMNYSVAVGSNKELGLKPTTTGLVTLPTTINATSSSNIANFQTTAALPSFIPAGFWEINLFANASIASGISAYFELYQRSSGGVETLIVSGSANPEPILNVGVEQYVASLLVPYTVLASGSSVVLKVFGSNSTGSSATLTSYYENGFYSHVHTTFGTIIPGDELNSTIIGLGTLGYISSSQLLSTSLGLQTQFQTAGFLSSQNLLGLVSTPNLLNLVSTTFLDTSLRSTTTGISRSGYISTPNLADLVSSPNLLNLVSTPFLNTSLASTVAGLGTGGLASIPANLSTFAIFTSSLMTSTMQSILISTGQLSVSSIGSVTTSTLQVFGSELVRFNGTSAVTLFGLSTDTLTLQTSSISYTGGIASLAFTTATSGYPLARIYGVDSATSGSAISQLVFQTAAASSANFNTTFNYTGSDQTFTVPTGVTSIQVTMWGAGGGGSTGATATGGAGAYIKGTLTVTPGQTYTVIVGQGGLRANAGGSLAIYGGGGPTSTANPVVNDSAGGGRSALQLNLTVSITTASGSGTTVTYTTNGNHNLATNNIVVITGLSPAGYNGTFLVTGTPNATQFTVANTTTGTSSGTGAIKLEIVNVGGGGGGGNGTGANTPFGGNATFSGTAVSGGNSSSGGAAGIGGGGGSQTAGGSSPGTNSVGSNGTLLQGGRGAYRCGGGGGGFWGGGGGSTNANADLGGGGGGGGSSYTSFSNFTLLVGSNSPNGVSAPAITDPAYVTGVAAGGSNTTFGGSGLINLATVGNSLSEAMRIGSNGFLGIGTTTPATRLDVVGTGRFDTVSTSALTVRSNAAFFGNASTVTDIQFFGLQGNYNNTVLGEVSTGAGTQEFLVFKGSSASDRIRMQTTGAFVVETGVSARLWSDTTIPTQSNITPAFVINTSSNVGIQTANPGATLDVNGTARAITLSSQQLFVSSVNGGLLLSVANIQSTVAGLGTAGYVSTSQLVSTTIAFQTAGFLSSQNLLNLVSTTFLDTTLQSTTTGISRSGYISTPNLVDLVSSPNLLNLVSTTFLDTTLQSTTTGISRSGFISTQNLLGLVSTPNLLNLVSTTFLDTTLQSTTTGISRSGFISTQNLLGLVSTPNLLNLVSTTFLDTTLQSTTTGISRSGYISTANLADLVSSPNLLNLVSTSFLNTTLASTVSGLGTGGLASIPANLSTFAIFTSSILASTIQTTILSTQQIFTSSITGNQSFFQALSSQSLFVSSFYTATRQMTPMFVTF